jgi:Tfp pilus assembly protein PilV
VLQLLSDRLRPADPADRDAGLSIVEVVVALLVFAVITVGSVVAVGLTLSITNDNRSREVATNLASEAVDVARGVPDVIQVASGTTTEDVGGITYTVTQSAAWQTTTGVDATCTPAASTGNGSLFYKRLQVAVTWTGMRSPASPVRSDTILAPNSRLNDQDTGTILVGVKDSQGGAVPGIVVTVEPDPGSSTPGKALTAASKPAVTNGDGCAVALKIVPGAYKVTISRSDSAPWRDASQVAAPVKTVVVAKGDSAPVPFTYELGDDYAIKYAANYTGGTVLLPDDLKTTVLGGTIPTTTSGTPSDVYLYPLATGYRMVAGDYRPTGTAGGSCLSPDPSLWPANAAGKTAPVQPFVAGSDGKAAYPLPMGVATIRLAAGNDTIISATSTAALNGDPGCAVPQTYNFTVKNATTSGEVTIALPYGTWAVSSGRSTSTLRGITLSGLIGSLLGTVFGGTGTSSNIVSLDPRPAS